MNLLRFGKNILKFPFWEHRTKAYPLYPTIPNLGPLESRQGVLMLSSFPNGAAIAATPLAGDRGRLGIEMNWVDAPPAWNDAVDIHVYKGGDAIEPLYVANPTNWAAGRNNIQIGAAATAGDVAVATGGAIAQIIQQSPGGMAWYRANGTVFEDPQTRVILISPRTAITAALTVADTSMAALVAERVLAHVVPFVYAGCRPGPQVLRGDWFYGYGPPRAE